MLNTGSEVYDTYLKLQITNIRTHTVVLALCRLDVGEKHSCSLGWLLARRKHPAVGILTPQPHPYSKSKEDL